MSMPTHLRPSLSAATQAVAQPQNGFEHDVALVAAGLDDAFEEGQGLLSWVADILFSRRLSDVIPIVGTRLAF